jgi:MFS family permease
MWLAFLTPAQVQLARQAALVDPSGKEALLGLVTAVGAAVTMLAVPLFGALSDRTRTRFGRRRPWIAGGAVVAAAGLSVLAWPVTAIGLVLGWGVAQLGLSAVQAGLVVTILDRVPSHQLGAVAGWAGLTQMLGALLGTVLVNRLVPGLAGGYLACALVVLVASVPFLLRHRESGVPSAVAAGRRVASARPARVGADVVWVWTGRFLVTLGFALVTQYLLYYLSDELAVPDPQRAVLVITAATVLCAMVAALLAGRWSDAVGRRRVFVVAGGTLMAAGALLLAVVPSWPAAVVAAVAVGLGFGTFLAVDLAVVAQVLPSVADTGRHLGMFSVASTAPQVLAPVVAVPVLAVGGYAALYALTAVACAAGGGLVLRVRSVR